MNTRNLIFPSNRVSDIRRTIALRLADLYSEGEVRAMTAMLFEAFLGWDTGQMLLHGGDAINQSDLLKFHHAVIDLEHYRPIQHIVGYTVFCGCHIAVSPDVLVPRPETEELVSIALEHVSDHSAPINVLDICTGSGCIAIALARQLLNATITALDLSAEALAIARHNANTNCVEINFIEADATNVELMSELVNGSFDLIVSNPPYVMQSERAEMSRNVLDYDPEEALFVYDADPLLFYRSIAAYAIRHLASSGTLVVEINAKLAEETRDAIASSGFDTQLYRDQYDRWRFVVAQH